jgi:hypothetical protein
MITEYALLHDGTDFLIVDRANCTTDPWGKIIAASPSARRVKIDFLLDIPKVTATISCPPLKRAINCELDEQDQITKVSLAGDWTEKEGRPGPPPDTFLLDEKLGFLPQIYKASRNIL